MNILIIDNYDSFTYNLYHMVEAVMPPSCSLLVKRNDEIPLERVGVFDKIIISPGPGLPKNAGISCAVIQKYAPCKSILGVCLGHQAMAEAFGGKLLNLPDVLHGKAIMTRVDNKTEPLFFGCPERFESGRYHSWVIDPAHLPPEFEVTATDTKDLIMAIRHRTFDLKGVQFHPESVMTQPGKQILKNWVLSTPGSKSV